jgi:Hr1 repeat
MAVTLSSLLRVLLIQQDLGNTISDIRKRIDRERVLINGARAMFSQTDNPTVQNRLRSNIHESERNINYLTERLKELELKAHPQAVPQQPSQQNYRGGAPIPPPKDHRAENGRGFDAYGQRGWQQQPGPGIPVKSRQYTKLGMFSYHGV